MITRIPTVVDRLIAEARAHVDIDQVLDGPTVGQILSNVLVVGLTQSDTSPGYKSTVTRQDGLGRTRMVEEFSVNCLLSVSTGDVGGDTMSGLRARCGAALAALDGRLRDLGPVEGVWEDCQVGPETDWTPVEDVEGSLVNVMFTLEGTAFV